MRLVLPYNNETVYLPGGKTYEERIEIVNDIINKYDDYINTYWEYPRVQSMLDIMGDYLARSKEFKENNKAPVLGVHRKRKLYKGDKNNLPFSSLYREYREQLGLDDKDDIYE